MLPSFQQILFEEETTFDTLLFLKYHNIINCFVDVDNLFIYCSFIIFKIGV